MKGTIIFLFFILSTFSWSATNSPNRINSLLQFVANFRTIRNYGLHTVIAKRCTRYMLPADITPCQKAVKRLIEILDYDIVFMDKNFAMTGKYWDPRAFVFVAFKKNLLQILSDEKTTAYLNDLNQRLYKYTQENNHNLSIWDVTLEHYGPSGAAKTIAALFQDTSKIKLHLAYLEKTGIQGKEIFQKNKELLSRVIDNINMILDLSEDNYRMLFYPDEIWRDLNRNIYHFYVPLYLAVALEEEGFPKRYAFAAPMLFNLTYEFVTTADDYRYLYSDPEALLPERYKGKLKDIYGGYCGASFGVKRRHFKNSFELIKETFGRSTYNAVELLLNY